MLKVSLFRRGFSQQNWTAGIPLKRRTAGGTPSCHHYFVMWLWEILISQILIYSDVQMSIGIFQKLHDSIAITLLATGDECHLDFSPKSCAYPTFVTIDPLELKIISILLLDIITCQCYSASLSLAIVHFLLLVGKNYCLSLFLLKNVWFINSKCFPFWKGCAVCPAQLTFVTLYLSHHVVTAWHRTDLLNPCNE